MSWGKLYGNLARSSVERLDEELVIPSGPDQKFPAARLSSTGVLAILSTDKNLSKSIETL